MLRDHQPAYIEIYHLHNQHEIDHQHDQQKEYEVLVTL